MNLTIDEMLEHVDRAREAWQFTADPGVGRHAFGGRYLLCIKDNDRRDKVVRNYSIELAKLPGHPITMSHDWDSFDTNLRKPPSSTKKETMTEVNNKELREKIRLKCKNDWDHDLSEDQISMCIYEMEEQKLSLFYDQLWPNKRKSTKRVGNDWEETSRITWDKTVDGYRAVAHRTGRFAGIDKPSFQTVGPEDGEGGVVEIIARVTVYALDGTGTARPYTGEARFSEFVQLVTEYKNNKKTGRKIPNQQWESAPYNQIAVTAERQALRKAFQELDSGRPEMKLRQSPEPTIERSRGEVVPPPSEEVAIVKDDHPDEYPKQSAQNLPKSPPKPSEKERLSQQSPPPEPAAKPAAEPAAAPTKTDAEPPPDWDDVCRKLGTYNGAQIVMHVAKKDGSAWLALDNGTKVHITMDAELETEERTDTHKGGKAWKVGDEYYDGSKVVGIAGSQKDELGAWLRLDDQTKVWLNQWGKELARKPIDDTAKSKKATKPKSQTADPSTQTSNESPAAVGDFQSPEQGPSPIPEDYRTIDTVEKMRMYARPLLKKWSEAYEKPNLSVKQAYTELTGVIIGKADALTLDDFRVLCECLHEALEQQVRRGES